MLLNDVFYKKTLEIENEVIEIYNYRLASYKDFQTKEHYELRGLTIIDGQRYPSIHKFFNVNECENNMLKDIKTNNGKVRVRDKLDGSLIIPVEIKGKIFWKTKNSFDNLQTQIAYDIATKNYYNFIYDCWNRGWFPIFELLSPLNQIVIEYSENRLVLTQVRTLKETTENERYLYEYVDYNEFIELAKKYHIPVVNEWEEDLEELLKKAETIEGIEGWVIKDVENNMYKIKTFYYLKLHHLIGNILNEKDIVEQILNEQIDDVLSQLLPTSEKRKYIEKIQEKINNIYNFIVETLEFIKRNDFTRLSRKELAIAYKNHLLFKLIMQMYNRKIENIVKDYILRECNKQEKAKKFLNL